MNKLDYVLRYGKRAKGRNSLVRHLKGEKITRQEAIEAKCYECMAYCADGVERCDSKDCPLWVYSPYGEGK